MKMDEILEPSACRYCGVPKRQHGRQGSEDFGWHEWKMPYKWQIRDRMKARRELPEGRTWRWQRGVD